jgi:hypothetical protein
MDTIRVKFGPEQEQERQQFLDYVKRISAEKTEEELKARRPVALAKMLAAGVGAAGVLTAYRKGHKELAAALGLLTMPLVQTAGEIAHTYLTKPKLEEIKREHLLKAYNYAKRLGAQKIEFPTGEVKVV